MPSRRNEHEYTKRRDALKRATMKNGWNCHLCGKPFDFSLPYTDKWAWTADHLDAVAAGGRMLGQLAPAHRSCNSKRQAKPLDEYLEQQEARRPAPTRRTVKW